MTCGYLSEGQCQVPIGEKRLIYSVNNSKGLQLYKRHREENQKQNKTLSLVENIVSPFKKPTGDKTDSPLEKSLQAPHLEISEAGLSLQTPPQHLLALKKI